MAKGIRIELSDQFYNVEIRRDRTVRMRLEMAIPAERIFRFLRRRVAVQYLILRSTRRVVSTNVNYHWPATVPLHSNRPLNQRMIGVLIDCYSVIITVHWQTPVSKPPSIEKRMLATVVQCNWLLVQSVQFLWNNYCLFRQSWKLKMRLFGGK